MLRHYVCNKHKSYSIRNHYFVNGKFETDDPHVQALIESAHGYGSIIHPAETQEEIAAMKAAEEAQRSDEIELSDDEEAPDEEAPVAVQGARGTAAGRKQRRPMTIVVGKE